MPNEIKVRAERAIREKVFPGCVIGFVEKGKQRSVLPFGSYTYDTGAAPVLENTIYDVASITKSIPTASLALHYIDAGRLALTDRLIDYVPEFRNSDREVVTIKHLLTYTLGGYALASLKTKTPDELYEAIMTHEFTLHPGTGFLYSNVPAFLLGLVIEKVGGDTLENLAQATFFQPLGMTRTSLFPQYFSRDDIAPTEIEEWRGHVQGTVHDESAYVFTVKGGRPVGHAGLFSTAPDLLNFLDMLLHDGELGGTKYLSPGIIAKMSTNQISELGVRAGLGWQLQQPWMGHSAGEHTFGKTGFTGTSVCVDIERGIGWVILSNRTFPKRPKDDSAIYTFRTDIADIVLR
ncbi:MAG: serine hydrolase domain-containing protein [Patescibacteria group bacterium]